MRRRGFGGRLCLVGAFVLAPMLVTVGVGNAQAVTVAPPVPTLGVPAPALGAGAADVTAGDLAWLESAGIDSSSILDVAAAASDVAMIGPAAGGVLAAAPAVGVAAVGLAAGYFIGTNFGLAYRWYFGASHVVNGDASSSASYSAAGFGVGVDFPHDSWCGCDEMRANMVFSGTLPPGATYVAYDFIYNASPTNTYFNQSSPLGVGGYLNHTYANDLGFNVADYPSYDTNDWAVFASYDSTNWFLAANGATAGGILAAHAGEYSTAAPAANPLRTIHLSAECLNADGSTVEYVTGDSPTFHETDATYPVMPAVTCPAGMRLIAVTQVERSPGLADRTLVDWHEPVGAAESLDTTYPACALPSSGCTLSLGFHDAASGLTLDCASTPSACAHWLADPAKSTDFSCTYGGNGVALSQCQVYAGTFNPPLINGTQAAPISSPDTTVDPSPSPSPAPESGCPPPMNWGLNLVSPGWYFKIGQCVLSWAFVPPAGTIETDVQTVQGRWSSSNVGTFFDGVAAIPAAFGSFGTGAANCEGPGFDFPIPAYGNVSVHPLAACTTPMSTVASTVKGILTVVIILGTVVIVSRPLLLALGMPTWKLGRGDDAP